MVRLCVIWYGVVSLVVWRMLMCFKVVLDMVVWGILVDMVV